MQKFIDFLKAHKVINLLLLVSYYLAVVLLHVVVGKFINKSFKTVSRGTYNSIILSLSVAAIGLTAWILWRRYKQHPARRDISWIIGYSLLAIIGCFTVLFVINIEAIHFVQYAILGILLFPLTESATATMIFGTIAGALDELYQYLVLDTRAKYYDFNDVYLDSVGTGLGLLCMAIMGIAFVRRRGSWYKRAEWVLPLLIVIILVMMAMLGEFSIHLDTTSPASFTLIKAIPEGFWHYPKGPYARFHILTPLPGLLLVGFTLWVYARLDRLRGLT